MFGKRLILIVEDECFTALDLAEAVEGLGGEVVGPVDSVAEALVLLERESIAGAVIDASLADRYVTPLAIRLAEEGVPFVIHSGTGIPPELAASLPDLPVVMKPVQPAIVLACLLNEMTAPGRQRLLV